MAVTEVRRRPELKAKFGADYRHDYTVPFWVTCDSKMEPGDVYIQGTTGSPDRLPLQYEVYNYGGVIDPWAYCLEVSLEMDKDQPSRWSVVAQYGKLPAGTAPEDQPPNPLDRPIRDRLEWINEGGQVVDKDRLGNPIVNTVGDAFDQLPEDPELFPVLVISKPYATLDEIISLGLTYKKSTNSVLFRGGAPRTVKFLPIQTSDIQYLGGVSYYVADFRFAYNPDTWDKQFLNRGWRYRPAAGQDPIQATDKGTRLPVASPVLLAADGTLLPAGNPPHYVTFQTLNLLDYNAIFS